MGLYISMKSLQQFIENMEELNTYEFYNAWQMIRTHILSAKSYLEAGHNPETVLKNVIKLVKGDLMNLEEDIQRR